MGTASDRRRLSLRGKSLSGAGKLRHGAVPPRTALAEGTQAFCPCPTFSTGSIEKVARAIARKVARASAVRHVSVAGQIAGHIAETGLSPGRAGKGSMSLVRGAATLESASQRAKAAPDAKAANGPVTQDGAALAFCVNPVGARKALAGRQAALSTGRG